MLSKYISKPTSSVVRPASMDVVAQRPKKVAKPRAKRTHGGFLYRNVAFSYANKGDLVVLHTWNDKTNTPNPGIIVPKEKKKNAIWALARIVIAEREIEAMGGVGLDAGPSNA